MTIFDFINSLLFTKKEIEMSAEDQTQFNAFMMDRWMSFYSPEMAIYVNETANKHAGLFADKVELYKYYYNIIPKCRFKRIAYIKKAKKETEEEKEAKIIPEFCSQREYNNNVELEAMLAK